MPTILTNGALRFSTSLWRCAMDKIMVDMGNPDLDQAAAIWQNMLSPDQLKLFATLSNGNQPSQPNGRTAKRHKPEKTKQMPVSPQGQASEMMQLMAKMILRQEDALNAMLTEHQFLLHINVGKGSIVPDMLQLTQTWKAGKCTSTAPLRHQLAVCMMTLLKDRLTSLNGSLTKDDVVKECWQHNILNQKLEMPFLRWNPQKQVLEPSNDRCLAVPETLKQVENILQLMQDETVTVRFHSLRRMSETPTNATPWIWTVSSRTNPELWHQIKNLTFHACWLLIQCRIKSHGMQRSPLAQQLSRHL